MPLVKKQFINSVRMSDKLTMQCIITRLETQSYSTLLFLKLIADINYFCTITRVKAK